MPARRSDGVPADLRIGIPVFRKRRKGDCGIACLKMLLNLPYDLTARAVHQHSPTAARDGVWFSTLEKAAVDLGYPLLRLSRNRYDMSMDTGILGLHGGGAGHAVLITRSILIDPDDGDIWSVDAYLKHYGYKPSLLLVREDSHTQPKGLKQK